MKRNCLKYGLLFVLLSVLPVLAELEVTEENWGFDGQVIPGRINLLSLKIQNLSNDSIQQKLSIYKASSIRGRVGGMHEQDVFFSPNSERWIQFYPYISQEDDMWFLVLGEDERRVKLRTPPHGAPARVLLRDYNSPMIAGAKLKTFNEEIFPSLLAATDGLDSMILDYDPNWEPIRRQVFIDWIYRGGTVHLFYQAEENYPNFYGELAVLNGTLSNQTFGAGVIVRHGTNRLEVDDAYFGERGYFPQRLTKNVQAPISKVEDRMFRLLKRGMYINTTWLLIFLFTLVYIALIGPVHTWLARKKEFYRASYLFYFSLVVVFSILFYAAGRRGPEVSSVRSFTYARALGKGVFDVKRWGNVFITKGKVYDFRYAGAQHVFSTCQDVEKVPARIRSGGEGVLTANMPIFSSLSYLHQGKMEGPDLGLQWVPHGTNNPLKTVTLKMGAPFPENPMAIWAHRDSIYFVLREEDGFLTGTPIFKGLAETNLFSEYAMNNLDWSELDPNLDPDHPVTYQSSPYFIAMHTILAERSTQTNLFYNSITRMERPRDTVDVFVLAEEPAAFRLQTKEVQKHEGAVLYHYVFGD